MRASVVLLCVTGVVACTRPSGAPSADAGALDAGRAEVNDAGAPEAAAAAPSATAESAPADAAPPRRSSCDLTPDEKRALEDCAYKSIANRLGRHGRFTVRVEVSGKGPLRIGTDGERGPELVAPPPGSVCAKTGDLLAPLAPCTWDVTGPFPSWTIRVVARD